MITDLIPQRPPMVMVDSFDGFDGESSLTSLTVRDDNIFCDGRELSECGLIEHIAQSAAARTGWQFREEGGPSPVGFIGSVNRFTAGRLPRIGETVRTRLQVLQEVGPVSLIEASSAVDGETVASCRMKIFLKDEQ